MRATPMLLDPRQLQLALADWPRLAVAAGVLAFGFERARVAVRRRLGDVPWDVEALGVATIGAAVLVVTAMALGTFSQLRDWTWALAALAAFAALGRLRRDAPAGPPAAGEPEALPSLPFLIVLGGVVAGRMLFSMRNPPADWDSYHYHLPMVAHWMQTGALGVPLRDPPVFGIYFPGNGEILQAWAAWAAGRETLMPWASAAALGLLGLAVRQLGREVGARAAVAEGVALAVALGPGLVQLTLGARIDDLVALWFAIALVFAVRARRATTGPNLALMTIALGLLAGTKGTGPVYAALTLVIALTGRGALGRLRSMLGHPSSLAVAAVVGGFWMARNAWVAGNPLFPAGLRLGPWTLPGLMNPQDEARTSQIVVWMEGYAGHTTLPKLWGFYGLALAAIAVGVPLWMVRRGREQGGLASPAPRDGARTLFAVAVACLVLYLFGPFSGAYEPASGGEPPRLNLDNLRLVAPTVVAFAPLAAAGLSRLPWSSLVAAALGVLSLFMLRRGLGHLVPGMVFVALALLVVRLRGARPWPLAARAAALVALSGLLALAVAGVEPGRERAAERAWDRYAARIHNLTWAQAREVRTLAAGRPIALAGLDSWWPYYGRDFSGHPLYVPVARDWDAASPSWEFHPEARAAADSSRWRRNLARIGPGVVVVGSPGESCRVRYVEGRWCAADSASFGRLFGEHCDTAFVVRPAALALDPGPGGSR